MGHADEDAALLARLFPAGHAVARCAHGVVRGHGTLADGTRAAVVGITGGTPVGIEAAALIAGAVLDAVETDDHAPIVLTVASGSQAMRRRDELLGLHEHLAGLAKALVLASLEGHRTIGVLHGAVAAGAFIATAMATDVLIALPGAAPSVMDLPSVARVTKLPIERLEAMARDTAVFAPGIDPLDRTGAVTERWDEGDDWSARLGLLLARPRDPTDRRDRRGAARGGRTSAAGIAERVRAAVLAGVADR